MNKQQERFAAAVGTLQLSIGDETNEFSGATCESCYSYLAGSRTKASMFINGETFEYDICSDCVFYHANGNLPESWRATPECPDENCGAIGYHLNECKEREL